MTVKSKLVHEIVLAEMQSWDREDMLNYVYDRYFDELMAEHESVLLDMRNSLVEEGYLEMDPELFVTLTRGEV